MIESSRIPGFHKLRVAERLELVRKFCGLDNDDVAALQSGNALTLTQADRMIENVISLLQVPIGVATNFLINGRDYLIPMATEEPSVVAAASNAARMARPTGGFFASATDPLMIGQIQLVKVSNIQAAVTRILSSKLQLLRIANEQDPILISKGGGAKDLEVRVIDTKLGQMIVVHLLIDCKDAMGANVVNTMSEAIAPMLERLTNGKACLRIVSNLADRRLARARTKISKEILGGAEVVEAILYAQSLALSDPYRCATHNKGVMNGVTAVALATGNDTRAVEAGAHAYAARSGKYSPLTNWEQNADGDLIGTIELPLAVGIIGGATSVNPIARICLKILGVRTARELAEVIASVGLAQNLAALRALVTEGIQRGHMSLHARNLAVTAGASGDLADRIAEIMVAEKKIRLDRAKELLKEFTRRG